MRWALQNPDAYKVIADYERFGQEPPESLYPPDLHDIEIFYWRAFWRLTKDRAIGMKPGPIPWSSIIKYVEIEGIRDEGLFNDVIEAMDSVYMAHQNDGDDGQPMTRELFRER